MEDENVEKKDSDETPVTRNYVTPKLVRFGSLSDLTRQTALAGNADGGIAPLAFS